MFDHYLYYKDTSTDDNDSPLTPTNTLDEIKCEPNRSENAVTGNSQGSPSMNSEKPNNSQEEKQDVHRCMWRGCTKVLNTLESLISHVGDAHIGSGKVSIATRIHSKLSSLQYFYKFLYI